MIAQNKKLLLVGPPGAGKTTIKKVYFDKKEPLELVKYPISPSRGLSTDTYSYSNSNLGIFDLAGQENNQWFSDRGKDVFKSSSAILCIFDITSSLELILEFLIKLYKIKKELKLHSCHISVFLHKIDKATPSYVGYKLLSLKKFIIEQHILKEDIQVYETSIDQNYFYNTFSIISSILHDLFDNGTIRMKRSEFDLIKKDFLKIIEDDRLNDVLYEINGPNINYSNNILGLDLERLEDLGLVKIKEFNNIQYFQLTQRAYWLRRGWKMEKNKNVDIDLHSSVKNFNMLLFLK